METKGRIENRNNVFTTADQSKRLHMIKLTMLTEQQIHDARKVDFSFSDLILAKIPKVFWQVKIQDLHPFKVKYYSYSIDCESTAMTTVSYTQFRILSLLI